MKKTLFVLLAILLIMAIMPVTGLAASTIYVGPTDDLNAAISGAADGDTIFIYDGTYTLNHVVLSKNLTIVGESEEGVILEATAGTAGYKDAVAENSAWVFVSDSFTLNLSKVSMDGKDMEIAFVIRSHGNLNVEEVTIMNTMRTDFVGIGIGIYPTGTLSATDVTMFNIERIGIFARSNANITGFDYTGKGPVAHLDYALNVAPIRDAGTAPFVVNISDSVIRNCGDSTLQWGSSALYMNAYYYQAAGGTTPDIATVNVDHVNIYDCEVGMYVGYSDTSADYSNVSVSNSNFFGCGKDMDVRSSNNTSVSTSGNYYGGGAPNVFLGDGDEINGIDTFVTTPVPMSQDTEVTAGIDPSYMIIIPAAVDFGTLIKDTGVQTQAFPVQAVGVVLEPSCYIDVDVAGPFVMLDQNGTGSVSLAYSLNNESGAVLPPSTFATFTADDTEDGMVSVDTSTISAAGSYKGTMDFTISYH